MNTFLPDQYQFAHRYSVVLSDQLRHLLIYGAENKVYSVQIDFSDDERAKAFAEMDSMGIASWLEQHGRKDELEQMTLMSLYPALLTDLFFFVDEALRCSEKARLTLTYALLRKPLRDNLFYLEWLLVEPSTFINTFRQKDPGEFSLERMLAENKVRPVIARAVARIGKDGIIDPDQIYRMRYEEVTGFYSLQSMWSMALHLVTTRKSHATEPRELNLIFANDEDRAAQWKHIYTYVPVVLDYAVDIAEALMCSILGTRPLDFAIEHFHRELGFSLWSRDAVTWHHDGQIPADFPNDLDDLHVACPKCGKKIDMEHDLASTLFADRQLRCPHCHRKIPIRAIVEKNNV